MQSDRKFNYLWLFQFFSDFLAICVAYYLTFALRFYSGLGMVFFTRVNRLLDVGRSGELGLLLEGFYLESAPRIILILTVVLCVLYALLDLYPGRRFIRKRATAWMVVKSNVIALAIFYTYFYLSRNVFHPRSYFVTLLFFNVILCVWFRVLMGAFITFLRQRFSYDTYNALMVGQSKESNYINSMVEILHPLGLELSGRIEYDGESGVGRLLEKVESAAKEMNIDVLILADKRFSIEQIMLFIELADRYGLAVKVLSDKMDVLKNQAKVPVDMIHGVPLVHFDSPRQKILYGKLSRLLSCVVAVVLGIVLLPLLLVVALLIKLTSSGPIFFIQERIGVNRRPFMMYKFRTMLDRADEAQAQLEEFNETNGIFKMKKDPRVTPPGRFLRRFSIDELPQLYNVLKGDMNIVGPRPLPRRDFEQYYEDWHYGRHSGLPGLTCLWQVSGRSEIDFHNMCILDEYYLRNDSWILDLKIFIKTAWVVIFGRGAY